MSGVFVRVALTDKDEIDTVLCRSKHQAEAYVRDLQERPSANVDSAWVSSILPADVPFQEFIPISTYSPKFSERYMIACEREMSQALRDALPALISRHENGRHYFSRAQAAKLLRDTMEFCYSLNEMLPVLDHYTEYVNNMYDNYNAGFTKWVEEFLASHYVTSTPECSE